jgi:hypothetical protein
MERIVHVKHCPDKGNLTHATDDVEKVLVSVAEITHPRLGHSSGSSAAFIRKRKKKLLRPFRSQTIL